MNGMIRARAFILPVALWVIAACATVGPLSPARVRLDMASIRDEIVKNRSAMEALKDRRAGTTGFYYVVDLDGTVVFHPRPALIGSSFRNHWFIERIEKATSGCLTYQLGNRTHVVFFERLNDDEALCLSILADELSPPPVECPRPE